MQEAAVPVHDRQSMSAAASETRPIAAGPFELAGGWPLSVAIYVAFAAAVFAVQGAEPLLGADHISYIQLTDSILRACPDGDYWRELTSVRTLGVALAYLHGSTGSHVLSMKVVLAIFSLPFLLAAELLFRLFATRWVARLFALLCAFAVSFGVASWGITDSTALLARTLVAPVILFATWIWFRFDGNPRKYLAFPVLVAGSLLHLSAFYMAGVLVLAETIDWVALRRLRVDWRLAWFAGSLVTAAALLFLLEVGGPSSKVIGIQVPEIARALGVQMENIDKTGHIGCDARRRPSAGAEPKPIAQTRVVRWGRIAGVRAAALVPPAASGAAAPPATAAEAWKIELALRPWRNMPLPAVNLANMLSSSALILLLAAGGVVASFRAGFTRHDRMMLALLVSVPLLAFGPQTALWILRSHTSVQPVNLEEVRAVGLVMIPALYFILRLFQRALAHGGLRARYEGAAIVVAVLALPLAMKAMPTWAREGALKVMAAVGMVDTSSETSASNARAALGLSARGAPLYYSTEGVRRWLQANTKWGDRILTDRDDLLLLHERNVLGPRQVGAATYYATSGDTDVFQETSRAIASRDLPALLDIARRQKAAYVVVPWPVPGALFSDGEFSVVVPPGARP